MSIPLLPHSNFLIQSLQAPCFPFPKEKYLRKFKKKQYSNKQQPNYKNKKGTTHIIHKTQANTYKKKLPFSHSNHLISQKKSSKVFTHYPLPEAPKTTFPKRKYICPQTPLRFPSNVKEFFQKCFGAFAQTLRHFGFKFGFSGRFSRIFFSRFIRIPVFIQETPPLQAF